MNCLRMENCMYNILICDDEKDKKCKNSVDNSDDCEYYNDIKMISKRNLIMRNGG